MALRFGSGDNKPGDKAWVVSEAGAESANPYFCYEYRRGVPRKVAQRHRGLFTARVGAPRGTDSTVRDGRSNERTFANMFANSRVREH